jgi:hypothetical protein
MGAKTAVRAGNPPANQLPRWIDAHVETTKNARKR